MKRYVIIATRNSIEDCESEITTVGKLRKYLKDAGWEVCFQRNRRSIFDAYSHGLNSLDLDPEDQIILCHDDIEILTAPDKFNEYLDYYLIHQPKTGFVGVSGSRTLNKNSNWFSSSQKTKGAGGGCVFHGSHFSTMALSHYGHQQKAVCLDGVFLASTKSVLDSIELRKPKIFKGNWHWYDASYTLQAHLKGLTNWIAPIILRHESGGNYDSLFYEDMKNFNILFKNNLPAVVN